MPEEHVVDTGLNFPFEHSAVFFCLNIDNVVQCLGFIVVLFKSGSRSTENLNTDPDPGFP